MENTVIFKERPVLNEPVLIEGLPGVGNVGKIAADHLAEELNAVKFAEIYSKHFPPQVTLDEDCVARLACNELYYVKNVNGRDLVLLLGDFQGMSPEGQFELADEIMNIAVTMNVTKIFTLGGYGTGNVVESPRVLGAVSSISLKPELEEHGVVFVPGEPSAGIAGASGLMLGMSRLKEIDAVCLMGETSGYFVDPKSSAVLLKVLTDILGIEVDMKELDERSQQVDEFTSKIKEIAEGQSKEQMRYIG
ncbi:MAG: proteasome assembly chaperone family protein [Methanomassiliicoccaceae archaeon]|nr:proteasome assembly chaperone family protein [Methanomassiliicoccaceae archaeon]MCL2143621.1 proteasome assembly chaperone family protein [Methanomassiliicoccaceae archaeon]